MINKEKRDNNKSTFIKVLLKDKIMRISIIIIFIIIIIFVISYIIPYFRYRGTPDIINKEYILYRAQKLTPIKNKNDIEVLRIKSDNLKEYSDIYNNVNIGDYLIKTNDQIVIYDDYNQKIIYKN